MVEVRWRHEWQQVAASTAIGGMAMARRCGICILLAAEHAEMLTPSIRVNVTPCWALSPPPLTGEGRVRVAVVIDAVCDVEVMVMVVVVVAAYDGGEPQASQVWWASV